MWTLAGEEPIAAVDISASNGSIDLTQFELGGANELPAGSTVKGSWFGGDATYYCKPVSGGKFYNDFIPAGLAPGNGSSTFAWNGYGNGGLRWRLRENQLDWDVLTEGCFDKYRSLYDWFEQKTNKTLLQGQRLVSDSTLKSYTHIIPYGNTFYSCSGSSDTSPSTTVSNLKFENIAGSTFSAGLATGSSWATTTNGTMQFIGEWRD